MKRYCFDTSGLSTPLEQMPEDIHPSLWSRVKVLIESGAVGVTREIYEEMTHIPGSVGDVIRKNESALVLEVGKGDWNFESYIKNTSRMLNLHRAFISEYIGGSKKTVGIVDISIVALASTLGLPVVTSEKACGQQPGSKKRHIPDICAAEKVISIGFNDFLRAEGVKV